MDDHSQLPRSHQPAPSVAFDHVGILVGDLNAGLERYAAMLGGAVERYEDDDELDCRWARIQVAGVACMELVSPRSETSPYAQDLRRRGEGLHHVSFRVDDLEAHGARLAALGLEILGYSPDHAGWQELFVHPRQTHRALVHFCVPPARL